MRKKKTERAFNADTALTRKKNVGTYFLETSLWHREWLKELAERYKAKGAFPMFPMTVLPSYYKSTCDRDIALFAASLLPTDAEYERIQAFRELLGENPWEWFKNREFVRIGTGKMQDKRTAGVLNWKIAKLFDRLWGECFGRNVTYENFNDMVWDISRIEFCSYYFVLTYLVEDCGIGEYENILRMLLMVACMDDGIGMGLWDKPQEQVLCPLTADVRLFLKTWFPDYRRYGSVDEAIHLFGFEWDCDFFYACLGYKELQKRNPKVCSEYATKYMSWYENCYRKKPYQWRALLPEIDI